MRRAIVSKVRRRSWTGSVPPAVAGGYVVDTLDFVIVSEMPGRTHPLPQVVLTQSKRVLGLLMQS